MRCSVQDESEILLDICGSGTRMYVITEERYLDTGEYYLETLPAMTSS